MVADKLKDAHHSRHTYDPTHYRGTKCPFRNWIYCLVARAATRRADQETRRQARNRQAQEKEREQQILSSPSQLKPNIDWKEGQPYVDQLPPKYKQAIELCDKQEMSRADAAHIAGCSVGAMKVRLHRAHQELQRLIEKQPCLDQLPPNERQAIILIRLRRFAPAEAARIARCSEHEIQNRLLRGDHLMKERGIVL